MILAAGAEGGFNWATVVASIGGALIAGMATLSGVIVVRRTERVKAHDDRIWHARVASYRPIFVWAHRWWDVYTDKTGIAQPPKRFSHEEYYDIELHGSSSVVSAFEEAVKAIYAHRGEQDRAELKSRARSALQLLIDRVQDETRGRRSPTTEAGASKDHLTAAVYL